MKTTFTGNPIIKVIFIENCICGKMHKKGDIVEAYWHQYRNYDGCYYEWGVDNHGFGKDIAIPLSEFREQRINSILNE